MTETTNTTAQTVVTGRFVDSLKRNNAKIRSDRADAIAEDAGTCYRRYVEDLEIEIRRMERERENMLDLSPENAVSLKLANNFDAAEYVQRDTELGWRIRNAQIKLDIARARYTELFGSK